MPKVGQRVSLYQQHVDKWKACTRCELKDQRSRVVHARGKVPCSVMFVGESPGESEDVIGQPFVGPAGKLLDWIIAQAWDGYSFPYLMTNLVGCFPREGKKTGDHAPPDQSIKACRPRLAELVKISRPDLVVTVGALATKWVGKFREEIGIGSITSQEGNTRTTLDLPHPAFLIRMVPVQRDLECKRCVIRLRDALQPLIPF